MTFHDLFAAAGWVLPVVESVPVWVPACVIVVGLIAWVTRRRDRSRFQETAAEAAKAPLPQRAKPVVDTRPGSNQEALATCNAIWYATVRQGGQP